MGKRRLDHVARVIGALAGPIGEGRAEAVDREPVTVHATKQLKHGHVAHWLARTRAGKHKTRAVARQSLKDREHPITQRNTVRPSSPSPWCRFHPTSRRWLHPCVRPSRL